MKSKFLSYLGLLLMSGFIMFSCGKDEDDEVTPTTNTTDTNTDVKDTTGTNNEEIKKVDITASKGAVAYSLADASVVEFPSLVFTQKNGKLNLDIEGDNGETISMILPLLEGEYELDSDYYNKVTFKNSDYSISSGNTDGTILTLSSIDPDTKTLSGTVFFPGTSSKPQIEIVMEQVSYKVALSETFTDTAYAELDGKPFVKSNLPWNYGRGFQMLSYESSLSKVNEIWFYLDIETIDVGVYNYDHEDVTFDYHLRTYGNNYVTLYSTYFEVTSGSMEVLFHDKEERVIEGTFNFSGNSRLSSTQEIDKVSSFTDGYFKYSY